jgi:hypothetical protein
MSLCIRCFALQIEEGVCFAMAAAMRSASSRSSLSGKTRLMRPKETLHKFCDLTVID